MSDNALLHFSYGHFYQRPSWAKMLGFPFVNYTTDMSTVLDPFADQITYMEQWQGFYGNPRLGYERSIQYELGLDLVYQNKLKFDFTGYYKDSDQEASVITGLYGKELPNQNGAPLRLIVPWKYGFKSAKAIVNIKLVEKMPTSSWMRSSPREYGFYSNVNPKVDHPRWSQASERVIGSGILSERIPTEMFNGFSEEVSNLYSGMDLKKNF